MAIRIQTEKPVIPIELGDVLLEFPTDDESIKNFRETLPEMQKGIESMEPKNEEEDHEMAMAIVGKTYDSLFGEGSYEKVYAQTPSLYQCMAYLKEITQGIREELKGMGMDVDQSEKAKTYLNKKKNKKKK